jgi:phage tail-like protein
VTPSSAPRYRFAGPAQWDLCLATAVGETLILDAEISLEAGTAPECGGRTFALGDDGEVFWVDLCGRLVAGGCQGPMVGRARRLVAGRKILWVRTGGSVLQLDRATLQLLLSIDGAGVRDIAPDRAAGLWLLKGRRIERIGSDGRPSGPAFDLAEAATAVAAADGTLAALAPGGARVELIAVADGRSLAVDLGESLAADDARRGGGQSGGFVATRLAGGNSRFLLAGRWQDGRTGFLLLDAEGAIAARGTWGRGGAPFAAALSGADLIAAFGRRRAPRLRRFPGIVHAGGTVLLTPALETESLSGGWQRAEIEACLPEGATLALRSACTADEGLRALVEAEASNPARSAGERLERIERMLDGCWSPETFFTYVGEAGQGGSARRFTFPIDAPGRPIAWVELRLQGNGGALPRLDSLSVLHDGPALIDHLPAVYRGAGDADGTMRRLVGVLEATTQDLDAGIARLAERLDPARADRRWLPGLAAMLGLPFDTGLSETMQRDLLAAAPKILSGRGARRGLVALAEALFPGRAVRVQDRTRQLSAVTLGGGAFPGSRLPALLAGPSARLPMLNARLVLGGTPLRPANPCADGSIAPTPEVAVTIPASGRERRRHESTVRQMLEALIPAGVRLRLRWTEWSGTAGAAAAGLATSVVEPRPLHIGEGQALGAARVGGRRQPRIDRDGMTPVPHRLL